MQSENIGSCAVCKKLAEKKCSRCKTVAYCSKECQASNWQLHKKLCQEEDKISTDNKINKSPELPCYECVPIVGKGEGMRAKKDINYGELIILEEAVMRIGNVVLKKTNPLRKLEKFPASMKENVKTQLEQRLLELHETSEKILNEYFNKLLPEQQRGLMKLDDCHQQSGNDKTLLGIVSTNGLIQENGETLVFLKISKLNNSCLPNVAFDFVSPVGRIYAVADIKKGEELCIDYGGYGSRFITLNERQEMLSDKYNFACGCELCTMNTDEYLIIESSRLRYKKLEQQIPKTTDPQAVGSLVKERFEMMKKGKLMYPSLVALHANDSFQLANGLGNQEEAKRYANMAYESLLIKYGKDNPRTKLYKLYLDNKITGNALVQNLGSIQMSI